ncbi:efflux RND transporter periplasmic adaptor subunit [Ignavibacterium sp.]|uniref:efflux RND transporter periplasmic adaptor subunit n=1 Tax=Ignavibacterium sp. TaxID=2651167 RepID=UPI00307F43F6
MKIPLKAAFVILFAVIIIFSFIKFLQSERKIESSDNFPINYDKLNEIVFSVLTKTVTKGDLIKSVSATGLVKPFRQLEIISNITGYIVRLNTYEGAIVKMNDLLMKFDDREYKIAMSEAEANLLNAKIEYGFYSREEAMPVDRKKVDSINAELLKLEDLLKGKKITEETYLAKKDELDLALLFTGAMRNEVLLYKSGMTNAINVLNRAKLNLSYTEIIAPFDGVIVNFNLVENQRINAGQKLFDIIDVSRLKVEVGILENEINKIKIGSLATIKLNAVPDKVYRGRVIQINPVIDSETKTSEVTVEIIDKDYKIKPGMFAYMNIETEIFKNRVLVPKEALLVRDRRNLVFVAEGELAKWRYVTIGEQNENFIEIDNGVQPGEKVIVEGQYNLAHESKIKLIE